MKQVNLYFDEPSHTYTDDEGNVYTSATTLIGMVEYKFDKRYWSMYRALEETGYKCRPDNKKQDKTIIYIYSPNDLFDKWKPYTIDELYDGVVPTKRTVEAITSEWQEMADIACEWGNERHNYLEDCINEFYGDKSLMPVSETVADLTNYNSKTSSFRFKIVNEAQLTNSPLCKSHPSIYALLHNLVRSGFILYAEKRIYSYEHRVSGTIDVLAVRGKEFYIVDWKTNKDELQFESGYYKKEWNAERTRKIKTDVWVPTDDRFKEPISHISYCKGNGYALQLSLYAYLCELWGFKCLGLILCHIRHKETIKDKVEMRGRFKHVVGIEVNKKELAPRIYNNIPYLKKEVAALVEWHRDIKVKGLSSKAAIKTKNATRPPLKIKNY